MNDKYYTPTPEEFYIGFQYERIGANNGETSWTSMVFGKEPIKMLLGSDIWQNSDINNCRVKYLDQEDIESLWGMPTNNWYWENLAGNTLTKHPDGNIIILKSRTGTCLFDGIIKNKSELIRLMKQINISK